MPLDRIFIYQCSGRKNKKLSVVLRFLSIALPGARAGGTFDFPASGDTSLKLHHWRVALAMECVSLLCQKHFLHCKENHVSFLNCVKTFLHVLIGMKNPHRGLLMDCLRGMRKID